MTYVFSVAFDLTLLSCLPTFQPGLARDVPFCPLFGCFVSRQSLSFSLPFNILSSTPFPVSFLLTSSVLAEAGRNLPEPCDYLLPWASVHHGFTVVDAVVRRQAWILASSFRAIGIFLSLHLRWCELGWRSLLLNEGRGCLHQSFSVLSLL